ncbi:SIS domain-containing protein [Ligilactobacillus pobuzihii]|uniref:Fructosamine deglycase n=2 Tax=Ligilactobacillus pobuzihii TaxID=449659 RepID=A0A0R2LM32_9LACO|nr:SIS domain-containing protein [Ligilactobacillus pobuzihii]KRK09486.1 sugar isomerase domain-containing protein [Ligilactobacillus pobuzihii E100301 = KCTC 13174]KRO01292.1 sugar isomerase domain-containing protein [Ligilactobacillus pobuzihii]GEN48878.1 glucosamine--fructose-6-phosphate aminotransferase [Ligilactobacillus pobuzihii]
MLKFDAEKFIDEGKKGYQLREKIEETATKLYDEGVRNIFFTASGGSNAVMQPFNYWMEIKSDIPSYLITAADFLATGSKKLKKDSLVILLSKSGDTKETVAIAKKMEELGVRTVSFVNKEDTPLQEHSTYTIDTFGYHPQEMAFYFLIGKILQKNQEFSDYERFADELKYLPEDMNLVAEEIDEQARNFAEKYQNADYQIWVGSGDLWGTTYCYSMCVLEESQWLRTKSVSSPEFFHGTFELVEKGVPVVLLKSEGPTRAMDDRVAKFASTYTDEFEEFDMSNFSLPHISKEYRAVVEAPVMWAALRRISLHLEDVRNHSLDKRRYYRVVEY